MVDVAFFCVFKLPWTTDDFSKQPVTVINEWELIILLTFMFLVTPNHFTLYSTLGTYLLASGRAILPGNLETREK